MEQHARLAVLWPLVLVDNAQFKIAMGRIRALLAIAAGAYPVHARPPVAGRERFSAQVMEVSAQPHAMEEPA